MIDASAIVELLARTPVGRSLQDRLAATDETLHAPQIVEMEVMHGLRRMLRDGRIERDRADRAVIDLADLRLEQHPHRPLLARVWNLRDNLSAYDAAYVALAERLDAVLVTADARVARAPGHRARVEVLTA